MNESQDSVARPALLACEYLEPVSALTQEEQAAIFDVQCAVRAMPFDPQAALAALARLRKILTNNLAVIREVKHG